VRFADHMQAAYAEYHEAYAARKKA
jgi:hypothetical protein